MLAGREEASLFCFRREKEFSIAEDRQFPIGMSKEQEEKVLAQMR